MRRLTLAAAAVAALVPATLGLVGNSSFAQSVPARVPASAQLLPESGDDDPTPTGMPSATPSATPTTEVGDDHGGDRPRDSRTEAGDDHRAGGGSDSSGPYQTMIVPSCSTIGHRLTLAFGGIFGAYGTSTHLPVASYAQ